MADAVAMRLMPSQRKLGSLWMPGRAIRIYDKNGYVMVRQPGHPAAKFRD